MTEQQLAFDNYLREVLSGETNGGDGARMLLSRFEEMRQEQDELREQVKAVATPNLDKVPTFVQEPAEEVEYGDFHGGD